MTTATVGDFLNRLTSSMAAELLGAESDHQLVERVLATRDEPALLAIVLRHGMMVHRVCRRVLRRPQDAEDAFQATFLVLAQQLHSLRRHGSLASWLHGVALRVSRKARVRAITRQRREARAARTEAVPPDDLTWGEVCTALDEELSRLPDRWRLPLVLCFLEGRTQDKAADQLGWSKSTLRRRLARARAALGNRLKGRGIAWSAVLPAVLASDSLSAAAMSLACMNSTVAAALAVVNGKSLAQAASPKVAVLTEGVVKTMFAKTIGLVAGALIVFTLVTAAVAGHFTAASAAPAEVRSERAVQKPALPAASFPLLERTSVRAEEPLTLKGHTYGVTSVCFSPDGKRIVTGGGKVARSATAPGEVKVWDWEKGTEILALKGHTDRVCGVSYSPDGKRIASTSSDGTLKVWDAEKGQELYALKGQARDGSLCFSPDSKRIASICTGNANLVVRVWDAEKGQELLTLQGQGKANVGICFSPDGKRIASEGGKGLGTITIWDAENGQELLAIKAVQTVTTKVTTKVTTVAFSPDGKRLASNGDDRTIRVWDAENGQELLTLKGHTGNVFSVCFSPDGKRLASASASPDQTVKVWDVEKGQELQTLQGHTGAVKSVCFSPDGKRLASASNDKTVKVWSLDKTK